MIYINANDSSPSWNKGDYLLNADNQYHLNMFKKWDKELGQVEYMLNVEPCEIQIGTKWTGLWHIDAFLNNDYHKTPYAMSNDIFIATTPECCQVQNYKAHVLFQACEQSLYEGLDKIKKMYDFVICGSLGNPTYTKREAAFSLLKQRFSYNDFQKGHSPHDYIKNIATARVQFIRTGEGPNGKCNAAQRFFECIAIGPVLTNWTPDLPHTGFIENEDFLAYRSDDEMLEKMERLIKDHEFAHKIARNGRKKALSYHTYAHRAVSIYNIAYADISIA